MELSEIWSKVLNIGLPAIVVILLGLIKIPKIEINIWKWLANAIGKAFNSEVLKQVKEVKQDVADLRTELDDYEKKFDDYTREDMHTSASNKRRIILEFNDDIMGGRRFSQEHWDSVLETIDRYERYCKEHTDFKNSKAVLSIENIKKEYAHCLKEGKFL